MITKESSISKTQLFFMIIQSQIGVGILSLPHDVSLISKNDGWISTLIAGLIVQAIILVLWGLCRRFPSLTIYEIIPHVLGKRLGKAIILCYILYFVVTGSLVLSRFSQIIDIWILQRTPNWILFLLMLGVCVYLVKDNLRSMARFYVLVTPMLIILFGLITYSLKDANFLYLLPIGQSGISNMIKGSKEATFSMLGFEFMLFLYPFVKASNTRKLIAISSAHLFVTLFYTYLVFASLVFFETREDLYLTPQPLLYMIKAYSFQIIERIDLFFLSIWIISVATSIATWLFLSSQGLKYLFERANHAAFLPYTAGIIFIIALLPDHETDLEKFNKLMEPAHFSFIVVIPLCLFLLSFFLPNKRHGDYNV
ncbi:GerAB/ArcD/ProY family transporter [Peribacillus frigoritolerans]|uniref:GerAB/ArcD/ProY family transporter n=1 Tax=Peribacillus frigoritolerans TaxID=450367 RepID=UPI00227E3E3A|nr:GerAB/ArcD/ProY family transporter [Peribacillus frigoritolerans]MCY8939320.1 spore germination protein [Peribacillus frigoritolerans]